MDKIIYILGVLLLNDMTSKFVAGFLAGIYFSTKYDCKPYVNSIEIKLNNILKDIEKNEIKSTWPWS